MHAFIKERVPEALYVPYERSTNRASTGDIELYREEGRIDMRQQITSHNIWEGRYEFKKRFIQDRMDHLRHDNQNLRECLFENILSHKHGYAKPGVPFLLNKFRFNGQRLDFHLQYGSIEEKVMF